MKPCMNALTLQKLALVILAATIAAGCQTLDGQMLALPQAPAAQQSDPAAPADASALQPDTAQNLQVAQAEIVTDISNYIFPTPQPTPETTTVARVATGGARANIRSGPSSDTDIIGKGPANTTYTVVSSSNNQQWWQICCVEDASGDSVSGWVADSVVEIEGALSTVTATPLLDTNIQSQWDVAWSCESERCEVSECSATIDGIGRNLIDEQWLDVNHRVTWDASCFSTDDWSFEVNRFTGQDRGATSPDNFLYRYWIGEQGNRYNSVVKLADGRAVAAWCSGGERVEVAEAEGWKTVYIGKTCHDARTGMLLTLSYQKQWLFTGQFSGNTYVDAFFGDVETMEQTLAYTNAQLLFVTER